jgi:hypothetical protein
MKTQVVQELDSLIQLTKDLDNVYIQNRLRFIKKLLQTEWNESDAYMEEIKQVLAYEETMNNLNDLKL